MELVNKIKKKLADAKRERYYRKGQLPWQMEGLDRSIKEYIPLENLESILIYTTNLTPARVESLREIYKYAKTNGFECLIVNYIPEEEISTYNIKFPSDIKIYNVGDPHINELGEVRGVFVDRLRSFKWDVVVIDFDERILGLDYLLHLTHAKSIVSDADVELNYADIQFKTRKDDKDNIVTYILNKIKPEE